MSLTVKELLETDEFKDYKVIAGEAGTHRKISSVSVMDAPDIYQWLRGGEILITTGYLFKDNLDFLSFLVQKIYEAGAAALFIKIGRFIEELPEEVRLLAEKLNFPIVFMPMQCAFTDVINPVLSKIIWEQAAVIEYFNRQTEKRYRDFFVRDIIYHNINSRAEIIRRGKNFGWNLEGSYRVVLVSIDSKKNDTESGEYIADKETSAILETVAAYFKTWLNGLIYTGFSDCMVLLIKETEETGEQYVQLSHRIMKIIREEYAETISVMVGALKKDIYEADKSFQEAQYTLNMAYIFGEKEQVLFYDKLGIYCLLDKLRDDSSMEKFSNHCLKSLEEYDRCHHSEYGKTLGGIIDNNWNLKQVAEKQFMHYNTIKKRYHRIEEILGVDFEDMSIRTEIELAVKYKRVSEGHKST